MIRLGNIEQASFGLVDDYPFLLGLQLTLGGEKDCWGTRTSKTCNLSPNCKWESDCQQGDCAVTMLQYVKELLESAKVYEVHQLVGKPIEATFTNGLLESFRILTEVL